MIVFGVLEEVRFNVVVDGGYILNWVEGVSI